MAIQIGGNEFIGSIGGFTFYRRKGKAIVRQKGEGGKEKLRRKTQDSLYKRNLSEFGRASSQAAMLRHSMHEIIHYAKDDTMVNRLNKLFREVIKTDGLNEFGYRTVMDGDFAMLEGFQFNQNCSFLNVFFGEMEVAIDRMLGKVTVNIPGFVPQEFLKWPKGATHYKFICSTGQFHFDRKEQVVSVVSTDLKSVDADFAANETLNFSIKTGSDLVVVVVIGIQFFQEVNGKMLRLMDLDHNAAMVIKTNKI